MLGLKWGNVQLYHHDDAWADEFLSTKEEIARLWSANVLAIEHVGSTAIKGISAKPIIDVAVVIKSFADMEVPALEAAGYKYMGERNAEGGRHMFAKYAKNDAELVTHHIHIYEPENQDYMNQIAFRDYLNAHPETAQAYNEIKMMAANENPDDRYAYSDAKRGFIEQIIRQAKGESVKRKAVFMDIDGTLLWSGKVSSRVLNAIQRARAQGHMFFICTGRSKSYLPKEVRDVDYLDGYVMACGMHCEIGGETIYKEAFDREELRSIARHVCAAGVPAHFEGNGKILSINSDRTYFTQVNSYEELDAGFENEQITKIAIDAPGVAQSDTALFAGFEVFDMGHYSDIVKKGVTKATGMQHILENIGISQADSIGIGDGSNDLPMIKYAGLGVAMGNAPENVKAGADIVTETCENDGVAVMIEKYVLEPENEKE